MNSGLLKNKTIVITGASQGIGYAVSQACAAEGARLILISRNPKDLKKAASALSGGPHEAYAMDVSSEDEAKKFSSYLKKKVGHSRRPRQLRRRLRAHRENRRSFSGGI